MSSSSAATVRRDSCAWAVVRVAEHRPLDEGPTDPPCPVCVGHGVLMDEVPAVLTRALHALDYRIEDDSERHRKEAETDRERRELADAIRDNIEAATFIRTWLRNIERRGGRPCG